MTSVDLFLGDLQPNGDYLCDIESVRDKMENRHRVNSGVYSPVVVTGVAQLGATSLGCFWGFGSLSDKRWLIFLLDPHPFGKNLLAIAACISYFDEFDRLLVSARTNRVRCTGRWLCFACGLYTIGIMATEPFMPYYGDITFLRFVVFLLPLLIGMSVVVRAESYLGLSANIVFVAVSLEMVIHNACSRGGHCGFLTCEVF